MANAGRPLKVDPIVNNLYQNIRYGSDDNVVIKVLQEKGVDCFDSDKRTALINASAYGKTSIVKWCIDSGADINFQDRAGLTALHFAAQEKNLEIAKLLINHGANVNIKDKYGNTPLWTAVFNAKGKYELVLLLIEHGADAESKNNAGRSAIEMATLFGDTQLLNILQKKGE